MGQMGDVTRTLYIYYHQYKPDILDVPDVVVLQPEGLETGVLLQPLDGVEAAVMEVQHGVQLRGHVQVVLPTNLLVER